MSIVSLADHAQLLETMVDRMIDAAGDPSFDALPAVAQSQLFVAAGATIAAASAASGGLSRATARTAILSVVDQLLDQLIDDHAPPGAPPIPSTPSAG